MNPGQAKFNILKNTEIDPRFVKPHTLLGYEKDNDLKLFEEGKVIIGTSPSKLAQPRLSINEIIAEKKLKEKRRFVINSPEERDRSMPELF